MSWIDAAILTYEEIATSTDIKGLYESKNIPISPEYLVEMERCGNKFVYKWKRKDAQQTATDGAN